MMDLAVPTWSWSNGLDQSVFAVVLVVAPIVLAWLWHRRLDRRKSLDVKWVPITTRRFAGDRFVIEAVIRNRTQAHREISWNLPEDSSSLSVYGSGHVEKWEEDGSHTPLVGPLKLPALDWLKLMFVFPTGSVGDVRLAIQLWETSSTPWQSYTSPDFLLVVESRVPSGWTTLSEAQRREFIERVLTQALERPRTANLTYGRILRFYQRVEAGELTVSRGPGVFWYDQGYSTAERVFLVAAAEARGITVAHAAASVPTHGWRRLIYY